MNPISATAPDVSFLADGGEMGRRIREFDWSRHPLGPPAGWPQSLKIVVRIMLTSRYAMWLGWGTEFHFFCNDSYSPTLGIKRHAALGVSARKVWEEIWSDIGPRAESVVRTGQATWDESLLLFLERSGYAEETYHTFSYSPVPNDDNSIGGMLCVVTEETERVIGARRLALLSVLGADLASINTEEELFRAVKTRLGEHSKDLPFALIYLLAPDGKTADLACAHHVTAGTSLAPERIALDGEREVWPAKLIFKKGGAVTVDDLATRFTDLPADPWDKPPRSALLVPIAQQGQEWPAGFLVAGLNPYRPLDSAYDGFLALLSGQIAAGLASARAYEAERKRADALSEIDRAKTAFFSNVSHEFRTPLTLLLGPLEEILGKPDNELATHDRALITVAHRNGLRLLKLVNSLLDFSRLEAGRARAHFEPTDLAAHTAELASSFRSAMERAGLDFIVDCPPLSEPAHVDREMWEKVMLNLLSNAFKFTLRGEVRVRVRERDDAVEVVVSDTGTGIPSEAKSHIFERFYRVEGTEGRTHEGSGIGLALVHELVKLHGGRVGVESELGLGSAFIITLPRGVAHLPAEQCAPAPSATATTRGAMAFVAEALRWLPDEGGKSVGMPSPAISAFHPASSSRPRILLADDNADVREYVTRLLSQRFEVAAVADGRAALDSARDQRPDLVLTDVMMPRLDGFGLLREMRADSALQSVPIILLSARAGEEARVEGLEAGADDYVTKPFHARELIAKVTSTLTLAKVRAEKKQVGEALLQSEGQLRLIADTAPVLIAHCDRDHRYKFVNAPYAARFGLQREQVVGRRIAEVVGEAAFESFRGHVERALEGEAVEFEMSIPHDEFGMHYMHCAYAPERNGNGRVVGLVAAIVDITDRKRAEMLLLEQHELLEQIAEGRPLEKCLAAVCTAISKLSPRNRACLLLTHADRRTIPRSIAPDFPATFNEALKNALEELAFGAGGESIYSGRPVISADIAVDGQWTPEWRDLFLGHGIRACRSAPVLDAHDVAFASLMLCIDEAREPSHWENRLVEFGTHAASIALDRDRAERALREAKETAELASQSKDRFLAVLSHELRTPLTPVLMALGALERDSELRADVREDLSMMKRNIELETRLIDDLLDLNRITSGKLALKIESVDLNEAVRHVCGICLPQIRGRGVRLETQLDEAVGLVAADSARLRQVLWNVLKNAIKFTHEEGMIRVTTKRLAGAHREVRIDDNGIGISAETLPHIFDVFAQGDASVTRQFGGLGLGLAICKGLMELHRGGIRAESPGPGHGASFIVELHAEATQPWRDPVGSVSVKPALR